MTQWSPPPLARWLLERALPADMRESVTGDQDEVFQRDCQTCGPPGARRRYWRQTMSFTLHFVVERWRDRRRGGLMRMGLSWLDFKLGFRMLSRYPMLTVVGSLAMAVAIGVGAGTFEVITRVTDPSLPLPGGVRCSTGESLRRRHLAGGTSNRRGHRRLPLGATEPDRGRASRRTGRSCRD